MHVKESGSASPGSSEERSVTESKRLCVHTCFTRALIIFESLACLSLDPPDCKRPGTIFPIPTFSCIRHILGAQQIFVESNPYER